MHFAHLDYGPNQNRDGGSQDDDRFVFDQTRFVLELEGFMLQEQILFEAEIEFEHGGTGSAMELEYEEFGEYEQEVEKGGEVVLEELYVQKGFLDYFSIRAGRFYVAFGQLNDYHLPTHYLATRRAESESTITPATWDEMGFEIASKYLHWMHVRAQVVNGLDSTGFSSQRWIASGHQTRFEEIRATDLAYVGRVDFKPIQGVNFGGSVYHGETAKNRPKPDLINDCDDDNPDKVAACGYISAPLTMVDGHLMFDVFNVRGQGTVIWGRLHNADLISERNARLSNNLNVLRSPVAEEALAYWWELGVDVAPYIGLDERHELEPFFRYDYYDTMYKTRGSLFDNPRFERTVLTGGLSYTYRDALVTKLDYAHRTLGDSEFNEENTATLAVGFVY
ncbi:MAG: hypothetical protein H6684_07065 [Deltaproteobacteria bacterium]|nr:hypothetical protein [Deltaproteobacteria bacterium]MCB9488473.1 hypothetical protein [Deltaproteobacteria bacterium]